MYTWDLSVLYKGLDDPQYISDRKELVKKVEVMNDFAKTLDVADKKTVRDILEMRNDYAAILKLASYLSLSSSTNTADTDVVSHLQQVLADHSKASEAHAIIDEFLSEIDNLDELLEDEYIKAHEFYLREIISQKQYQLSAKEEALIAAINLNGVNNWEDLYDYLTSSYTMDYKGEAITLTEVRNLAYSDDAEVRKSAYEAELAGYKGLESSLAYSLNSIKGHVNTMVDLRGYKSPIHMTLEESRMSKETLDAMFSAIDDSLPKFRQFLQHKGKLLGHENGLPFYDLFAPLVKSEKEYSIEFAQDMIKSSFATFSPDLHDMVETAFENDWIDYLPRANKRGGAFCSNQAVIKQSFVLSNFGHDLSGVVTLAHELGHAYHGYRIENHYLLNTDYVMPIAETASNFCELILSEAAMKTAERNEKIELLENMISDATQTIVDIYSRYLFEQSVFDNRKDQFLSAEKLVELMEDAQLKTYGEGLDKEYLHGYMWACKPHYYSSGTNFYNFPYAYGALFSKGLYAKYLEEGESFVAKYDNMLTNTTVLSCEDIGALVDVDVTTKAFWKTSLNMMEDMIDEFIELTSEGL